MRCSPEVRSEKACRLTLHERWWLTAAAALAALASAAGTLGLHWPSTSIQLALLAAAVAIVGLPHGGGDWLPARRLLKTHWGDGWPLVFYGGYLTLALLVAAAWLAAPTATLACFLAISVGHFADEPARCAGETTASRWAGLAEGAAIVAAPTLTHFGPVRTIFVAMTPGSAAATMQFTEMLWWLALLAFVPGAVAATVWAAWAGHPLRACRLPVTVAMAAALPPVLAFAVYFCGWHSLRHALDELTEQASEAQPRHRSRPLWAYARRTLPHATAATIAATAAWLSLRTFRPDWVALTQVVFVGLSIVAIPHILLHLAIDRWGAANPQPANPQPANPQPANRQAGSRQPANSPSEDGTVPSASFPIEETMTC